VPSPATIGQGSVRAALILPLSVQGGAGRTAGALRAAAEMAIAEFQNPDVSILVFDDQGTPAGAQAAATQAIQNGAQIIIGPLLAPAVQAVGQVARASNVPVIAFSSDETVAGRGVYLLSFPPSADVQRAISYVAAQGRRQIAALLPEDAYGQVVDGELRTTAARVGARIVSIERYPLDPNRLRDVVRRFAPALRQADVLYMPDGADAVSLLLDQLRQAQAPLANLKLLGSGRWDDPSLWRVQGMTGAWFPAPESAGFAAFAQRFRARNANADPVRTASLGYDATLLVAALSRQIQNPQQRFSEQTLANPNGFAGVDGIFRFRPNGTPERGLAVNEIRANGIAAVSPAPRSFTPSGT
jgi:ABC-type branched-subunit amino acid transport system substrate-binding protein